MAQGRIKLEIIDLANTSGSPVLSWVYSEGGMDGSIASDFSMKFQNETDKYSVPVLVRGLGPSLQPANKLADPFIHVELIGASGQLIHGDNDNWGQSIKSGLIDTYNYEPPSGVESAYFQNVLDGSQYAILTGTDGLHTDGSKRARLDIIRVFPQPFREVQIIKSGVQSAWLQYDVTTGMTNKKVFAYSMEVLQQISGVSGITDLQTSGNYYKPTELMYYSGFQYSGRCVDLSLLIDDTGSYCEVPEDLRDGSVKVVCLTGDLTSGQINTAIANSLSAITAAERAKGTVRGNFIDDSAIVENGNSIQYITYQGLLEYNQPYSGDYLCIEPYVFDYTGDYQQAYGVNPPYPAYRWCFNYGTDYSNINQLVFEINNLLSGSEYPLWDKNVCADSSASGYYENGPILKATQSGDNGIYIEAMRLGLLGRYKFTFFAADRPLTGIRQENMLKYLLPGKVSLQGSNTSGSWTTLDSHTSLNWGDVRPTVLHRNLLEMYTGFATGAGGQPVTEADDLVVTGAVVPQLLYEAEISGLNNCQRPFYQLVQYYLAPSGFECAPSGPDNLKEEGLNEHFTGSYTGTLVKPVDYYFLKTGWKFNNTSEFNYYRLLLENFQAPSKTRNVQLENSFYINGVSFFGYETGTEVHSGDMCLMGGTYTGQIMGITSGLISGVLSGNADGHGVFCADHQRATGQPNYDGTVVFRSAAGKATTPFTGLVTACATGTGYYSELVQGFFYNAATQCVEFEKPVSGTINGSGELMGGPYGIIRDEVWPTLDEQQVATGAVSGLMSGIIPDFLYNYPNIPAFSYITGLVTGIVQSGDEGTYSVSQLVSVVPASGYSFSISGYRNAQGSLSYGSPQNGEYISVNGISAIYSNNPANTAPTYFNSQSTLVNILNSGSDSFGVTATSSVGTINLFATESGSEGNSVTLSSSGGVSANSSALTGGLDFYYPVTPTTVFTGLLEGTLYATGFFAISGYAFFTGVIKQLDFVRTFTGLWNFTTGGEDFRDNGWISGAGYQNSGFSMPFYSGNPNAVPMVVAYTNNPLVLSTDLALLTVTGIGTNSGIQMILSGQF